MEENIRKKIKTKIFHAEFLVECLTTLTTNEEAIDNDLLSHLKLRICTA